MSKPVNNDSKRIGDLKKEIKQMEDRACVVDLRWNPKNKRFDGPDSNQYTAKYKKLQSELRQLENKSRSKLSANTVVPESDLRENFCSAMMDYKYAAGRLERGGGIFRFLMSDVDRLGFDSDMRKNFEATKKNLCKASYVVKTEIGNDGSTISCEHISFSRPVKCNCRLGKNGMRKILSDELLNPESIERKFLVVFVNNKLVDFGDSCDYSFENGYNITLASAEQVKSAITSECRAIRLAAEKVDEDTDKDAGEDVPGSFSSAFTSNLKLAKKELGERFGEDDPITNSFLPLNLAFSATTMLSSNPILAAMGFKAFIENSGRVSEYAREKEYAREREYAMDYEYGG